MFIADAMTPCRSATRDDDERFRALATASSEGILIHREGIIIDANDQVARVMGHSVHDLIGKHILDFLSEDARMTLAVRMSDKAKSRTYDITGKRPDGERYYAEIRSEEVIYQGIPTRVAVIRDITERKKIEESLRQSEFELRGILENMQDTFYRTEVSGKLIRVSPSCYELLQYTPEELLGTYLADLYVYPRERQQLLDLLAANDGRVKQHRTFLRRKDGAQIWVATNAQYYYDARGNVAGVEGTTRDITHMIRAEEQLQQALAMAEAASKAKSEFLAVMSHEIRTPLNGVLTMARLLETTRLDESQRRYVETINSSGRLLYTLLNDILDLSKLEAGKLHLEHSDFELHQVISELQLFVEPLAIDKGLDFKVDRDVVWPLYLKGDRVRFEQALLNLLSNAVKFTQKGLITLSVTAFCNETRCLLEVVVSDTGIGIPPAEQQRIFKPFEQGDASITRRFGGTGLGLAITRELVELMSGAISVQSEPEVGTRFKVVIPFEKGSEPRANNDEDIVLEAAVSFLLVDDDAVNRSSMGALLERDGHAVQVARDGFEAIDILAVTAFDYLLIDVHMPGLDGIETVVRWKKTARGAAADARIIALTADTRRETIERCHASGIPWVLPKPLMKRDLYKLIKAQACAGRLTGGTARARTGLLDEGYLRTFCRDVGLQSMKANADLFQTHGAEALANLLKHSRERDSEGSVLFAHRLAGSSRMLGMNALADAANAIERRIRGGDTIEQVASAIGGFERLYHCSVAALLEWLDGGETGAAEPVSRGTAAKA